MDGTLTLWLDGHTDVLGRLLLKSFRTFPLTSVLWQGIRRESNFGKIYGGEINL